MRQFCIIVTLLGGFFTDGFVLPQDTIPQIYPSYITDFTKGNNLYANNCFENIVQDKEGRLWLNSCGNHTIINSLGLTYFDGYEFSPFHPKKNIPRDRRLDIAGINSQGELYGAIGNSNLIFTVDPKSFDMAVWPIPGLPSNDISIKNIIEYSPEQYYILSYDLQYDSLILTNWSNGHFSHVTKVAYPSKVKGTNWATPLLIDENEVWFMATTFPLVRYNIQSGTMRVYDKNDLDKDLRPDFNVNKLHTKPILLKSATGTIYFYVPGYYGNLFFSYDKSTDQFLSISGQVPQNYLPADLVQDSNENLCFLFQNPEGDYKAILENTFGVRYDYSPVLAGQKGINKVLGKNFLNDVFIASSEGLFHVEINSVEGVHTAMKDNWISSMVNIDDTTLLVNSIGAEWKKLNTKTLLDQTFEGPDCGTKPPAFGKGMKQQIQKDDQGNYWFLSGEYIVKYNPDMGVCTSLALGNQFGLFALLNDHLVVMGGGKRLQLYDIKKETFLPFPHGMIKALPGRLRCLFVDDAGLLWITTNGGLLIMDLDFTFRTVLGEDDVRFTSVCEMPDGHFWLGTYFQGIWVLDPISGKIRKIQHADGLSNNAVMSIIVDNEGYVWVGTENGINILSPDGNIIGELHTGDGLTHEIFERFDPYKDIQGRIYFGSRNGINVIDPEAVRKSFEVKEDVNIYLTEITYYAEDRNVIRTEGLEKLHRISLPAQRRYLTLKFALSSYIEPSRNQFYYKLKGIDDQWRSLGNQRELNLNHLPSGDYTLLIKGENVKHKESIAPISLTIHAAEYFYKEWWFYLIILGGLSMAAMFWIRNLRRQQEILEFEVIRRTNQIRTDKETIEQQAQKLRQLDKIKTRFFNNISHELRTPLTLIKVPVEKALAQTVGNRGDMAGLLWSVQQNSKRLLSLINGYLELSKLDIGMSKSVISSFDLSQFVGNITESFRPAATSRQVKIEFVYSFRRGLWIETDKEKLETILSNIMGNAIKFVQDKGCIKVNVEFTPEISDTHFSVNTVDRKQLMIKISDDGPGIATNVMPHIFERYYQAEDQNHKGSGIGLAISRELTELLGGTLTAESEPGHGSTFSISLPVIIKNVGPIIPKSKATDLHDQYTGSKKDNTNTKHTILIVEDDRELQQLLKNILAENYDIVLANHGKEAWNLMTDTKNSLPPIDALVCDLMMPVMDGMTLLKKMKENKQWNHCPIIVLSAKAEEESKLQTLRMGVDDYLIKPFSAEELIIRLENIIANDYRRKSVYNNFKGMVFDDVEMEEEVWLSDVQQIIKSTLKKNIECTVSYVAEQINLSDRQLNRRLKSLTGLSTNLYIREVKLQNARHLLENKSLGTVAEIAYASGFNSPGYFSKMFFQRFGQKPGEYL